MKGPKGHQSQPTHFPHEGNEEAESYRKQLSCRGNDSSPRMEPAESAHFPSTLDVSNALCLFFNIWAQAHLACWLFQIIHSKLIYSPIPQGKSFHSIDKGDLFTQKEAPDSKMKLFFRQLFPCLLTSFSDRSSLFWVIITLSPLELGKSLKL